MRKLIILFIVFLILASIAIGLIGIRTIASGQDAQRGVGGERTIFHNPIMWVILLLPVYTSIMLSTQDTTYPITTTLHMCRNFDKGKKNKRLPYYVSHRFHQDNKYKKLLVWKPTKIRRVDRGKPADNSAQVIIKLKDGSEYNFLVIRRNRSVDGRSGSDWVIDNIWGGEFGS